MAEIEIPVREYDGTPLKHHAGVYGYICNVCGEFIKDSEPGLDQWRKILHRPDCWEAGMYYEDDDLHLGHELIICGFCRTQSRCTTTGGIHSEIYTLDDDNDYQVLQGAALFYWPKGTGVNLRNQEVLSRLGVCSACHAPMMWDVYLQRWTDLEDLGDEYWLQLPQREGTRSADSTFEFGSTETATDLSLS